MRAGRVIATPQPAGPIPARIRPHLSSVAVLVVATAAGLAVALGQESPILLAYVAALAFVLPVLAGRPELMLALVVGLCVVAVGPFARADEAGAFQPSSMRLPLLILTALAVLSLVRRGPGLPAAAVFLYASLLLFLAVGVPFSPDPAEGVQYLLKLCVPLIVAAAIASLRGYGVKFAEVLGLGALGLTLGVDYVLLAVGGGYYLQAGTETMRFGGLSASGPSTGFVLSLLGVFALVVWLSTNRRVGLLLWAASFPILIVTLTRSGIAAWLIGSLTALLIARRPKLAIVLVTVAVTALVGNTTLADRSTEGGGGWGAVITSFREHGFSGINSTGRTDLWSENVRHFAAHPWTGNGLGAAEYYTRNLTSGVLGQAHSEYLTLLVGGGIVAFALWIMAWLVLTRAVWRGSGRLAVSCLVTFGLLAAVDNPIEDYAQAGAMIGIALGWGLARNASEFDPVDHTGRVVAT